MIRELSASEALLLPVLSTCHVQIVHVFTALIFQLIWYCKTRLQFAAQFFCKLLANCSLVSMKMSRNSAEQWLPRLWRWWHLLRSPWLSETFVQVLRSLRGSGVFCGGWLHIIMGNGICNFSWWCGLVLR